MIPSVPPEKLLQAMEEFDKELRDTDNWSNCEQNGAYKHAIVHNNQRSPVKQIISMATGEPKTNFSGGIEANRYVSKRGLSTVPLQNKKTEANDVSIHDRLEEILAHYASVRANGPFAGHELWDTFKTTQRVLEATTATRKQNSTLKVEPSRGQSKWVTIPWIAVFDARDTNTIQRGVYCAYLFREDMSGVYLTLAQGATEPKEQYGAARGREHLRAHAENLRQYFYDSIVKTSHSMGLRSTTTSICTQMQA